MVPPSRRQNADLFMPHDYPVQSAKHQRRQAPRARYISQLPATGLFRAIGVFFHTKQLSGMTYIDILWHHSSGNDPTRLVSELDADRCELRKLEFFA